MPKVRVYNLAGKQLKVSPLMANAGEMLRCVNMESTLLGAKKKRPGYVSFLGTAEGSAVIDLFSWTKEDGTSTFVYRNSGGKLNMWEAGIGTATAWTDMEDITAGNHLGHAVLADTLIHSQVGGTTRSTTDGTTSSDTSGAPPGKYMASHQNRIHIGSSSTDFWSASGSGTDWSAVGTSDSSSQTIPGPGQINAMFVADNKTVIAKSLGNIFRWDGYTLIQTPTDQGPSSPYSVAETEDYYFWLNRNGIYGYNGDRPELLSNAIEKQIYNNTGSAIAGTSFDAAPGVVHRYNYYCAVGDTRDDLSGELVEDCIIKYDYQANQLSDYKFAHFPTSWTTYKDNSGDVQLIFGDEDGQCYTYGGTATSDGGSAIEAVMEMVFHFDAPEMGKFFKEFYAQASPGCSAKVQVSAADSFTTDRRKWVDIGQFKDGLASLVFPPNTRGNLLFVRIYESSTEAPFTIYGFTVDFDWVHP